MIDAKAGTIVRLFWLQNIICIFLQEINTVLVLMEEHPPPAPDHHSYTDAHVSHASFPSPHVYMVMAPSSGGCQQTHNPSMKSTERKPCLIVMLKICFNGFPFSTEFDQRGYTTEPLPTFPIHCSSRLKCRAPWLL